MSVTGTASWLFSISVDGCLYCVFRAKAALWQQTDALAYEHKRKSEGRWLDNSTVTKCMGCAADFSLFLRKVGSSYDTFGQPSWGTSSMLYNIYSICYIAYIFYAVIECCSVGRYLQHHALHDVHQYIIHSYNTPSIS